MYNLIYAFIVYVVANSLFNVCCLAAKPAIVKGQRAYYYTYAVKKHSPWLYDRLFLIYDKHN